jgi:hypothetical protein
LIGPDFYDERLFVYPGMFTNPTLTNLDEPVAVLIEKALEGSPDLAIKVVGRLIGGTLGHEIIHSIIGLIVFEQTNGELGDHLSGTSLDHKGDVMLNPNFSTFDGATGVLIAEKDKFPAEGSFSGPLDIVFTVKPKRGGSLDEIERNYPVPPAFQ